VRYCCYFCFKSVTSELPVKPAVIIRAILVCPECIEAGKIKIPGDDKPSSIAEKLSVKKLS
jgi:hypothetical protein